MKLDDFLLEDLDLVGRAVLESAEHLSLAVDSLAVLAHLVVGLEKALAIEVGGTLGLLQVGHRHRQVLHAVEELVPLDCGLG